MRGASLRHAIGLGPARNGSLGDVIGRHHGDGTIATGMASRRFAPAQLALKADMVETYSGLVDTRFQIVSRDPKVDRRGVMAREIREGLLAAPRSIPPKYFYDDVGSRLFDVICELPEYYLTRAERALLIAHSDAIVANARCTAFVEIGSGMARKTAPILRAMALRTVAPLYVPFDIASEPIRESAAALLTAFPTLRVRGVVGDFMRGSEGLGKAAPPAGPRLFAFLGSTIGNLDDGESSFLLRSIARQMTPADRFLIGMDLVKDPLILHAAYNDSRGVTAAFNKNVLRVLARELDGDIDVEAFDHLAFYEPELQRIEMHLVSRRAQTLVLREAGLSVRVEAGERVRTEISRKFTRAGAEHMLRQGGMRLDQWIVDGEGQAPSFALGLARAA
jgi:L-histidine N-alpha-methyltransferase